MTAITFAQVFVRYADQINYMLRNKSTMYKMGFRNGSISSVQEPFIHHTTSDYSAGFLEGFHYATYKLVLHNKPKPKEEPKPEPVVVEPAVKPIEPITVGYVVQNYDFSFSGLEKTSLAERHTALVDILFEEKTTYDVCSPTKNSLLSEEDKLLDMISYLRQSSSVD